MQELPAPATRDELRGRIRRIVITLSGVEPTELTAATTLEFLELDGVGLIELFMAIEDEFDLEISEADADGLTTMQDILDYLAERLSI